MTTEHRTIPAALALVLGAMLSATACGNLTAGGVGEVVVSVSGDASAAAVTPALSTAPVQSPAFPADGGDKDKKDKDKENKHEPEGELEAVFDLFLLAADGTATQLNDERVRVEVDLRGRSEMDAVDRTVTARAYDALRVVFTEIEAEVKGGLLINGVPVVGKVKVKLKDVSIEVTRPISLDVGAGERAELLVDLNAAAWLQAVDPVAKTVDPSVFAGLIQVLVR